MPELDPIPWKTNPLAELRRLAWPICVSMLSFSVMNVVDTAFVGTIGTYAIAGVGFAGTMAFALLVFGIGLLRGLKVLVSLAFASQIEDRVERLAAAGLIISAVMGVFIIAVGQLVILALPILAGSAEVADQAAPYLAIRLIGSPMVLIHTSTREVTYGLGNSRSAMLTAVVANVANVVLDYLFIIEMDMGTAGAGWASTASVALEMVLLMILVRAPGLRNLRKGLSSIRSVMEIGVVTGLQEAAEAGSQTILTLIVAAMVATEMAAHQITFAILLVVFLPILAISEAASILVGQAVGADHDELVPKVAKLAIAASTGYTLLCALTFALTGPQIIALFTDSPEIQDTTLSLLWIATISLFADAFGMNARSILRGTGDVQVPTAIVIAISLIAVPPLSWLFGHHFEFGALGAWSALIAGLFVSAAILTLRLARGHWRASAQAHRGPLPRL